MSLKSKRLIWKGPADGSNAKPLNVEGLAVAATLPGSVVGQTAAGLVTVTDATGDFAQQFLVADKNQQQSRSIDTVWPIDENMVAIAPRSGEFMNVLVITAQAIASDGVPLARSATLGALKIAATDGTDEIVAYSDEIVTTTATQLVAVRIA